MPKLWVFTRVRLIWSLESATLNLPDRPLVVLLDCQRQRSSLGYPAYSQFVLVVLLACTMTDALSMQIFRKRG
jgi:hypothetical protein